VTGVQTCALPISARRCEDTGRGRSVETFDQVEGIQVHIAVIGTGYVGLVTGACFTEMGNHVVCVDVDENKLARLRRGEIPIYEPGLEPIVENAVTNGLLRFTNDLSDAMAKAEYIFIAVGTPPGEDGSADLQYVVAAARSIGQNLHSYAVVIDKSTVPVGTGEKVRSAIAEELA